MITLFTCLLGAFNDVDKYIIMFIIIVVNHMPRKAYKGDIK